MDQTLATKLAEINQKFYSQAHIYFDETRQKPWKGWETLLSKIPLAFSNCLDVGCGNGRFAALLAEHSSSFKYTGIDFNQELLDFAHQKLSDLEIDFKLIKANLLDDWNKEIDEKFDLVVAFGVLHHIPGFQNRKLFLKKLSETLNNDGVLVITVWQFLKLKRFSNSMPNQQSILEELEISKNELEENDFILDWKRGTHAYRYSHLVSEYEFKKLLPKNIQIVDTFHEDGKTRDVNKYYILRRIND